MRKMLMAAVAAGVMMVPFAGSAHTYVNQKVCSTAATGTNDCARVDSDTEFEDGAIVVLDGDDASDRGDGYSDGYVAVTVSREGEVTVYCEDNGGYNYGPEREGGEDDDANGTNEECGF